VNLLFFIRISSFKIPRKFYFQIPSKIGGITLAGTSFGSEFQKWFEVLDIGNGKFAEEKSEALQRLGFHRWPKNGEEFLQELKTSVVN
jgi:hypothetical protein